MKNKDLIKKYLDNKKKLAEETIKKHLDSLNAFPKEIHSSMRYSVLNGGKRLRPILVLIGNEIAGGKGENAFPVLSAVEFVHCYSLIHDDLPALDNDDYRRGKLTNHKKFGEAIAILAGDALLTKAFEVLSLVKDEKVLTDVLRKISKAIGTKGMIGGQVMDILSEGKNIEKHKGEKILKYIHLTKTAALIEASIVLGAITAKAPRKIINALSSYGKNLGLLFQISDDILDVIGDKKKLGKSGTDERNKKLTYPKVYGIEKSKNIEKEIALKAKKAIKIFKGFHRDILEYLVDYVISREK